MFKRPDSDIRLEEEINRVLLRMSAMNPTTDEYAATMKQFSKLVKLKEAKTSSRRISPDTLAIVAGNLLGVVVIVAYEKHNIVTSKALTFVQKLK